ncbi:MAG: hypothetical protein V4484_23480 [Pseudomonadota bacterium]
MKLTNTLALAVLIASSAVSFAAATPAAPAAPVITVGHVKAVTALMEAMQAEKLMTSIAYASKYSTEEQRAAVLAKVEKTPKDRIYARLAFPLAKVISAETASEMARFYATPKGKQVVYRMYNDAGGPVPLGTPAERKDSKRPEFIKANKELADADAAIRHEGFVLLQQIGK